MNEIFNRRDQTLKRQTLRTEAPLAERKLWALIRGEQQGAKFRRQVSIERYVVDFYCPRLRLAIEIDGDSHTGDQAQAYDAVRQSEIEALGITFMRFSNQEIYRNAHGIAETIGLKVQELKELKEKNPSGLTPSGLRPSPPPRGGERAGGVEDLTPSGLRPSPPPRGGDQTRTLPERAKFENELERPRDWSPPLGGGDGRSPEGVKSVGDAQSPEGVKNQKGLKP